jgi:hypothetical protein
MFRAEITIRGNSPHEQRYALAQVLRSMADHVTLSSRAPIEGASPHVISVEGKIAGSYFFDEGLKPVQRAA